MNHKKEGLNPLSIKKYWKNLQPPDIQHLRATKNKFYDIVIVLTVWKRNNLERQLLQVKNQSILKDKKVNIIIFQIHLRKEKNV